MSPVRTDSRFTINSRRVIHEVVDGEVIVIQLETGSYYSLSGLGADAWPLLISGRSPAETGKALAVEHEVAAEQLCELVDELVAEQVLKPLADGEGPVAIVATPPRGPVPSFEPPRLEKYSDMQDYLLIDPIHEVDEPGWPVQRAG